MKTLKKNNKGFSLVELIVVILIMAIIAVALAPQVMKWVETSKYSTDNNSKATLKSAIDAAVADCMYKNGKVNAATYYIKEDGLYSNASTKLDADALANKENMAYYIVQVLNNQYPGLKQKTDGSFKVEISDKGAVTITIVDKLLTAIPTPTPEA